jgi:hypothetical protein
MNQTWSETSTWYQTSSSIHPKFSQKIIETILGESIGNITYIAVRVYMISKQLTRLASNLKIDRVLVRGHHTFLFIQHE